LPLFSRFASALARILCRTCYLSLHLPPYKKMLVVAPPKKYKSTHKASNRPGT